MQKNKSITTKTKRSQKYFKPWLLFFYDVILYRFVSQYIWRCKPKILIEHYKKNTSKNHLELGVGTGYLLKKANPAHDISLSLMDLSQSCLEKSAKQLTAYKPKQYQQNILEPIANPIKKFDSIGINYVLHCIPGDFNEKSIVFKHLNSVLNDNGILFGSTVLHSGVKNSLLAQLLMWICNRIGLFNNKKDQANELYSALKKYFNSVELQKIGSVGVFIATNKQLNKIR